jgi:hypothetical protein
VSLATWLRRGALVLVVSVAGCGSTGGSSGADADAAGDAADASAPETDGDGSTVDESSTETGSDGAPGDGAVEHEPTLCAAGTACNQRLDGQHLCPGACVALASGLSCGGEVRSGLCFGRAPVTVPGEVSGGGFTLRVRSKPAEVRAGESFAIAFDVTNTAAAAAEARVGIKPGASASLTDTGDFDPAQPVTLAAGATRTITTHLQAETATILDAGNWSALDVIVAGTPLDPRGLRVAVPFTFAQGTRTCGTRVYPDFVTTEGQNYGSARCCGGVFYPGAQCCTNADCAGGATCADGVCVEAAPHIPFSGSPLAGPQRVLIVLADEPEPKPPAPRAAAAGDLCADVAAQRADVLGLPLIGKWFADVARRRAGRALTDFRYTVLAGIKTEDFAPASNQPPTYGAALEAFLVARGCTAGWGADFDRVLIMSPRIETGAHQGLVYAADRVAVKAWSASIATHELAHTFGATDRYWDAGGQLQYGGALMSTVDRDPDELLDAVFWAEAGLGDVDHDGVIDALAFSTAPEHLELTELVAEANKNNRSLSIRLRVGAREGGAPLAVVPREMNVELAGTGVSTVLTIDGHRPGLGPDERDRYATSLRANRDLPDAAFDAVVAAKNVSLRVRIDHHFTDAQFVRRAVSLDETREVTVAVTGNGNTGPLP